MAGGRPWEPREDAALRSGHRIRIERLHRTGGAIKARKRRLGIARVYGTRAPRWTADEDDVIREAGKLPVTNQGLRALAEQLGRTYAAVRVRAYNLRRGAV